MSNHYGTHRITGDLIIGTGKSNIEMDATYDILGRPSVIVEANNLIYTFNIDTQEIWEFDINLTSATSYPAYNSYGIISYDDINNRLILSSNGFAYFDLNTKTEVIPSVSKSWQFNSLRWHENNSNYIGAISFTGSSPQGTLWNTDGYLDISDYQSRWYESFVDANHWSIGFEVLGHDFIMHDTINNKYYKVKFTQWTQGNGGGGFEYDRTEIINATTLGPTVHFVKTNYGSEVDVIDTNLSITRGNNQGIYNSALEAGWSTTNEVKLITVDSTFQNPSIFYTLGENFSEAYTDTAINQLTGDIYTITLEQGVIYKLDIIADNGSLISSWTNTDINDATGIVYDEDLNRVYYVTGNILRIIDCALISEIYSIDLSSYGSMANKSITYNSGKIIVGITQNDYTTASLVSIDTTTFDIIDLQRNVNTGYAGCYGIWYTNNYYLHGDPMTSIHKSSGTQLPIDHSVVVDTELINSVKHTLQAKDGTIAHLDDIPVLAVPTGKLVWVDKIYGNNGTAILYDYLKPYSTIQAAINAATSGDTVYVRPGSYIENVVLKNGVNIHCDAGVTVYAIQDAGTSVTCRWTGHAIIDKYNTNDAIKITGISTNFYGEFFEIKSIGTIFVLGNNSSYAGNVNIKCVNIRNIIYNSIINRPWGTSTSSFNLEVTGYVEYVGGGATSSPSLLQLQNTNASKINIKINEYIVRNSNDANGGMFIFYNDNAGPITAEINVEVNKVTYDYNYALASGWWFIHNYNSVGAKLNVKINKPFTLKRRGFLVLNGSNTTNQISANVTTTDKPLIYNNLSGTSKARIYDSYLKRDSSGSDLNECITAYQDNNFLELDNVIIHKDSIGTDNGELIHLFGANSTTIIKNSEIYLTGVGATGYVCDANTIAEGHVYFKNTISNIDNTTNITDDALVSGFIGNDTNLNNYLI